MFNSNIIMMPCYRITFSYDHLTIQLSYIYLTSLFNHLIILSYHCIMLIYHLTQSHSLTCRLITAGSGSEAILQSGQELSRGVHQERSPLRGVMRPTGYMIHSSYSYSTAQSVQPSLGSGILGHIPRMNAFKCYLCFDCFNNLRLQYLIQIKLLISWFLCAWCDELVKCT